MESPRSVLEAPAKDGLTAVVLGCGVAGICGAQAAAGTFDRVVLVEGDMITTSEEPSVVQASLGRTAAPAVVAPPPPHISHLTVPAPLPCTHPHAPLPQAAKRRPGILQYAHPHTLAMGGLQAMEALLPGFKKEVNLPCRDCRRNLPVAAAACARWQACRWAVNTPACPPHPQSPTLRPHPPAGRPLPATATAAAAPRRRGL